MRKFSILAGAALVAVAGVAVAQPAPAPRADRQADMTRQQVIERVDQRFARLDLDNDGRVTPEEARRTAEQRRTEMAGRMFDRLDANRDGSISRAEFDQARAQRAERRAQRGHRAGMAGMHVMRRGGMRGERLFGEQGFLTREQMRERALAHFDRLDADRNGVVTAAEREQARQQFRQRMMERRGRSE